MRIPTLSPTSRTGILVAALFMLGVSSAMETPEGEPELDRSAAQWTVAQGAEHQQNQQDSQVDSDCGQKS